MELSAQMNAAIDKLEELVELDGSESAIVLAAAHVVHLRNQQQAQPDGPWERRHRKGHHVGDRKFPGSCSLCRGEQQ